MTVSPFGVPYIVCGSGTGIHVYKLNPTGKSWMLVGFSSPNNVSTSADYISIAVDSSNTVYLASQDASRSNRVSVSSCPLGAASWTLVGQAGFSDPSGMDVSITIAPNGAPLVIGSDGPATFYRRSLASASGWETVGPSNLLGTNIGAAVISVSPSGIPYALVNDLSIGYFLSVIRASFD
jgi:hypothetical protein